MGSDDYISKLRKCVGHQPLLMVGASVLALNDKDEVLMLKRADTHDWGIPGGSMELGEMAEQTARRELLEETNLTAHELELFGVFSGPEQYFQYPNGDEVYNVSVVYIARGVRGKLKINDGENSDPAYFDLAHLPENIGSPIRPVLKKLAESLKR
jgi:ADP-ribose pyrophosphatase YjhB (NUDIX family)